MPLPKPNPCPLCGQEAQVTRVTGCWNISCEEPSPGPERCGLVLFGGAGDTRRVMVERWNRRVQPATPTEDEG
jgi:hypothetical protein